MKPLVFAIGFHTLHIVFAIEDRASVWAGCFPPFDCKTKDELPKESYEWAFENQPTAPCLDFNAIFGYQYFADGLPRCITSDVGYLHACRCWNNTVEETYKNNKYCNPVAYGVDNTMCKYPEPNFAPKCGDVLEAPEIWNSTDGIIDQDIKDAIVAKHNALRAKIAEGKETKGVDGAEPPASDMMEISWNDGLAITAQRWAIQCIDGHDIERSTEKFPYVGQNVAYAKHDVSKPMKAITDLLIGLWYGEVEHISHEAIHHLMPHPEETGSTGMIGHFTQLVWDSTFNVGCGFVKINMTESDHVKSVLVCNYGPGGNIIDKPVYKIGEAGSECPKGTTAIRIGKEKGLCKWNSE